MGLGAWTRFLLAVLFCLPFFSLPASNVLPISDENSIIHI